MKNVIKRIKNKEWLNQNNQNQFWNTLKMKIYNDMDMQGKNILDIGPNVRSLASFFISKGADLVVGYSLKKQYLRDPTHIHLREDVTPENIKSVRDNLIHIKFDILNIDCEGSEWNFTDEFIDRFDDWVIALHSPNPALEKYMKENGNCLVKIDNEEYAIYRKNVGCFEVAK
jgi:hypothetical protein